VKGDDTIVTRADRHQRVKGGGREDAVHFRPARRAPRGRGVPFAINFAPMIDVTFLLLIFFLVTTTFERAEGILASKLPRDAGAPAVPLPLSPIVVRLTQTGPGGSDYTIGVDNVQSVPQDFERLADFLRQLQKKPGFDNRTPVIILADPGVRWDHVVNGWNAAVRCGYENIAFGGS
jgi:biopolymer transport protein ExbD